ncbi:putative nucleotidyltransferase, ribonuclease H [Tanacetum coccineum]|uniref:Nucleotidyltransferase, ribonuclease H n=1 Tax=Tanacetum coccineum TaxID=301880 RepID=A0ABQ4YDR8_9ASTR
MEKVDTSKELDDSSVIIKSNGTESQEQDTSSRSGNDAHVDDVDIRPIYDEEPKAEVQITTNNNVFVKGQQHTEQPEFINEGEIVQNAEQCHDTCPLPAKLTDDKTIELSNQLLESENVIYNPYDPTELQRIYPMDNPKVRNSSILRTIPRYVFTIKIGNLLEPKLKQALVLIGILQNPSAIPLDPILKLTMTGGEPLQDPSLYKTLVGKLIYLTITRPNLAFLAQALIQFLQSPTILHMKALTKVLRYVKLITSQGQSVIGNGVFLGLSLISWQSKKQLVISRSFTEAGYRALIDTTCEVTWIKYLLKEFQVFISTTIPIMYDNASSIALASNPVHHARTKHIKIDCHFVRDKSLLVSWMVTDLEDSKTHTVGGVWSGEYMDHGFTKSMSELDRCYTMLQELRSVIVGGALIHKNREGSKHEGRRIRPTIGDFGGNCASNQSPFNNGRIEEWEEKKKEDRVSTTKIFCSKILINNSVCSLIIDGYSINNFVSRKLVDFLMLPMEICPIEGYQVCRVPMTIGKSYKVEVLCIVDDIDECHILLVRPWRCEVNGKYDVKQNLYLFSLEGRKIAMFPTKVTPNSAMYWERRRIAMVPPKVTPQLPKPDVKIKEKIGMVPPKVTPQLPTSDVKVEEKIVKVEVVDEHIEKIQDLQTYKQHDDNISTLSFGTTNTVSTLKICEEIMGFNDDEDVKSFNCELKMDFKCVHDLNVHDLDSGLILRMIIKNHIKFSMYDRCVKRYEGFRVDVRSKSIKYKVRREKVFEVDEALDIENSRASSFQVRGIHVDKTKVNAVRNWSLPKTLPDVRNIKVADAFQEEDELEYANTLDGEAEQVTYVIQRTLCSPKVSNSSQRNKIFQTKCLVKEKICSIIIDGGNCEDLVSKALVNAFKLLTEPHPNPYQIGWIKKGLALKVNEICKVPLAIGKHYNELVTCDVVDMEACHVLLGRPWQHDVDSTHQRKLNMYLFKWSGKTIAMLPLGVVSLKKKLESKTLETLVASPKEFQAERKETGVSYA